MGETKVKRAEVINAVSIPGSKVNSDYTLSKEKNGCTLTWSLEGLKVVTDKGTAIIPPGNVKFVLLADK